MQTKHFIIIFFTHAITSGAATPPNRDTRADIPSPLVLKETMPRKLKQQQRRQQQQQQQQQYQEKNIKEQ